MTKHCCVFTYKILWQLYSAKMPLVMGRHSLPPILDLHSLWAVLTASELPSQPAATLQTSAGYAARVRDAQFWLQGNVCAHACVRLLELVQILTPLSCCSPCPLAQVNVLGFPKVKCESHSWCTVRAASTTRALTHSYMLPVWIHVVWSVPLQPVASFMLHSYSR